MNNEKELTVEFIKARLLDAELKLKNKDIKLEKTEMDFSAQRTQKCFKCGKPGHKAYQCKQIWRDNSRGRSSNRGRGYSRGRSRNYSREVNITENDNKSVESFFSAYDANEHKPILSNNQIITFIIDSGATENLVQDKYEELMYDIKILPKEIKIKVANGQYLTAKKKGFLDGYYNGKKIQICALLLPGLCNNIISVKQLVNKGYTVTFKNRNSTIFGFGKIYYGEHFGKLDVLKLQLDNNEKCNINFDNDEDGIWHKRLGHLNRKCLKIMNYL